MDHSPNFDPAKQIRRALDGDLPAAPDTEAMLARFWTERAGMPAPQDEHRRPSALPLARPKTRHWYQRCQRYGVALLVVVAVLGTGVWMSPFGWTRTEARTHTYRTAPGQRSTVRLADGSTILLAPATAVAMTAHGVAITGEAYFAIAPHSTRPFVVRTANALVQVLGTRFSVRQYPTEARSRVVVEDGRVALTPQSARQSLHGSETRTIVSSQMLAVVTDSGVTVTSGIAVRDYTSWLQGTLVLKDVTLRDAVTELARAYGADIQIADTALAKHVVRTQVTVTEEPLHLVLASLCNVTGAHVTRAGRTYVLAPGRGAIPAPLVAPLGHLNPQPEQQYGR